jgi:steroid delta-isomerase-like uncharacterized protein
MTGERTQTAVTSPADMRDEITALFARREDAFDNLDAAAIAADYADDVVIESPISGTHGKVDAERNVRAVFAGFMDLKMTFEPPVIDGSRVAQLATAEGTNLGGFMGLPPSGRPFKMTMSFFYEVKGGKIVREQRIYDFTGLLLQVGILKAKPA